jgi:hypothetical protein
MVSCFTLSHKTSVAFNDGDGRILDLPLANVAEGLTADGSLLGCFRGCPAFSPVVRELLDEVGLESSGLYEEKMRTCRLEMLRMKDLQ